jgi:DNA mismatch repair protein MutS
LFFLRKLNAGPASRSYGIDVAKQAGLPESLTQQAQNILDGLVQQARDLQNRQLNLLDRMVPQPTVPDVSEKLLSLKVDSLTPLEALNKLHEFQRELQN